MAAASLLVLAICRLRAALASRSNTAVQCAAAKHDDEDDDKRGVAEEEEEDKEEEEEEAVFIRDSATNENPPNAHQDVITREN